MSRGRDRVPALTGLRGIAALAVVFLHYSSYLLPDTGQAIDAVTGAVRRGYLWVDLFFLLSGFVLAHVYAEEFRPGPSKTSYAAYARSRFARIYPLHLVTLAVIAVLEASTHPAVRESFQVVRTKTALALNLVMLQSVGLDQNTSWNYPAWSLSAEWLTYLALPFWIPAALRLAPRTLGLGSLAGLGVLYGIERLFRGHLDVAGIYGVARCMIEAGCGVLVWRVYRSGAARSIASHPLSLALAFAGLAVLLHGWMLPDAAALPLHAALVLCAASAQGTWLRLLDAAALQRLGRVSFALYMVHAPLQALVQRTWVLAWGHDFGQGLPIATQFGVLVLVVGIALACATMIHHWVEEPARARLSPWAVAPRNGA